MAKWPDAYPPSVSEMADCRPLIAIVFDAQLIRQRILKEILSSLGSV